MLGLRYVKKLGPRLHSESGKIFVRDEEHSGLRAMPKMKIGVGIMCVMTLILSVQGRILHLEESVEVPRNKRSNLNVVKSQKIF
jgi:hypothetical protein